MYMYNIDIFCLREFQSKVESIATKEKELLEAEKSDSYITFTNEP